MPTMNIINVITFVAHSCVNKKQQSKTCYADY